MTTQLVQRRKRAAATLALIAGAVAAVAAVTVAIEYRSSRPDLASGLVMPGLSESIAGAQRINVVSSEASYRIERTQRGWAMRDRDDYPVASARLAQLTQALEQLRYTRRMTSDSSKHERLGVTDPRADGRGILVQIEDGRGALLVNLIFGIEPSGVYVREPDEDQTWAVAGELPPLREVSAWLDLHPVTVDAGQLARVEIAPAVGRAYIVERDAADQPWRFTSPPLGAVAPSLVASTAERITQLSPTDVRSAPAIQGLTRARVRAITTEGLAVEAELIDSDQRTWVKLVARAQAPEQEAAALEINDRVAGWAYALSSMEAEALAPPLSTLLPGAE
jgi:hypothetical protein